jgi:16S rRNA (guanine966-N2)-methyltransferase
MSGPRRRQPPRAPAVAAPQASGRIRVIGGSLRGSRLAVPALEGLRPTPDRVRETLFNWLQPVIVGSRCLDLFAGSGALGIEAASRGAREVLLVERDALAARALRENLLRLKVAGAQVVEAAAASYLAGPPQAFDVVFLDPPFAAAAWSDIATALARGWLAAAALVYVESPAATIPALPADWLLWREGRSGAVRHALYRHAATP